MAHHAKDHELAPVGFLRPHSEAERSLGVMQPLRRCQRARTQARCLRWQNASTDRNQLRSTVPPGMHASAQRTEYVSREVSL